MPVVTASTTESPDTLLAKEATQKNNTCLDNIKKTQISTNFYVVSNIHKYVGSKNEMKAVTLGYIPTSWKKVDLICYN